MGQIVYGYLHEHYRSDALDWLRKRGDNAGHRATVLDQVAATENRMTDPKWEPTGSDIEHSIVITNYLLDQLCGTDAHSRSLFLDAMIMGDVLDRSRVSVDVRNAISRHGINEAPHRLSRQAATLINQPGHENRALMLACVATLITERNASETMRSAQRRRFLPDSTGFPSRARPLAPSVRRSRR